MDKVPCYKYIDARGITRVSGVINFSESNKWIVYHQVKYDDKNREYLGMVSENIDDWNQVIFV